MNFIKSIKKSQKKYIELNEIVMLIKSLCDDKLIINNNEVISEEQRKILCNGIDVVIGRDC